MGPANTRALTFPPFTDQAFTATEFDTAADKAWFANALCRFIETDFQQTFWQKRLYSRLSDCFGHIAHYAESAVMRTGGVREGMSWLHLTIAASLVRSRSA